MVSHYENDALNQATPQPEAVETVVARKKIEHENRSWWIDIAGLGTTIVAGLLGAAKRSERNFWTSMQRDEILDEREDRELGRRKLLARSNKEATGEKLFEGLKEVEKPYKEAQEAYLKNKKLDSFWRRYKTLRPHERKEVRIAGAATAAITLGVVAAISEMKRAGYKQDEMETRLEAKDGAQR